MAFASSQAFHIPRSNPDSVAVTVACLDVADLVREDVTIVEKKYNGEDWEQAYEVTGIGEDPNKV